MISFFSIQIKPLTMANDKIKPDVGLGGEVLNNEIDLSRSL